MRNKNLWKWVMTVGLGLLLLGCGKGLDPGAPDAKAGKNFSEGWVSSGGELVLDDRNPWWLFNLTEFTYCIVVDPASFSSTPALVEKAFLASWKYWQDEIDGVEAYGKKYLPKEPEFYGIAGQTPRKVEKCDDSVDLRILAGYGALGEKEKKFITQPQKWISLTVRTSYDPISMHGKGFTYLGSDRGPFRFNRNKGFHDSPWRVGWLLKVAMAHELGHPLGLGHRGRFISLMSERYLEIIFSLSATPNGDSSDMDGPLPSYFLPNQFYLIGGSKLASRFFNEPEDRWFNFMVDVDKKSIEIKVLSQVTASEEAVSVKYEDMVKKLKTVGTIENLTLSLITKEAINIVPNPLQKVFPPVEDHPYLMSFGGPWQVYLHGPGEFVVGDKRIPVNVEFGPESGSIRLWGVLDGKMQELSETRSFIE